jgi:hypothetical protein
MTFNLDPAHDSPHVASASRDKRPSSNFSNQTFGLPTSELFAESIQSRMQKTKRELLILVSLVLGISACAPVAVVGPAPPPGGVVVAVEDRPYYVHGPSYFVQGRRWIWVSGHWGWRHHRRVWIHGHYVLG